MLLGSGTGGAKGFGAAEDDGLAVLIDGWWIALPFRADHAGRWHDWPAIESRLIRHLRGQCVPAPRGFGRHRSRVLHLRSGRRDVQRG